MAFAVLEIARQKIFVRRLGQQVKSQVAPVQFDPRVHDPRRRHARAAKDFPADGFAQAGRIAQGIVQQNFRLPVEARARHKFVELHGQAGFLFERLEAVIALEPDSGRQGNQIPLADDALDIFLGIEFEPGGARGRNFNFQMQHLRLREKLVRVGRFLFYRLRAVKPGRDEREQRDGADGFAIRH